MLWNQAQSLATYTWPDVVKISYKRSRFRVRHLAPPTPDKKKRAVVVTDYEAGECTMLVSASSVCVVCACVRACVCMYGVCCACVRACVRVCMYGVCLRACVRAWCVVCLCASSLGAHVFNPSSFSVERICPSHTHTFFHKYPYTLRLQTSESQ